MASSKFWDANWRASRILERLLLLLEGRCEVKDSAGTGFLVDIGDSLTSRPHDDLKESNLSRIFFSKDAISLSMAFIWVSTCLTLIMVEADMGLINGAPRWVGLLTWAYKEKHQNKSSKRTHFSALWPLRFELIHTLFIQWPSHAFLLFSLSTLGQFLVTDWKFSILYLICTCMK